MDLLQGTLDVLVLRSLAAAAPWLRGVALGARAHGRHAADRRRAALQGAAAARAAGCVTAEWGVSENNRRARYYRLTPAGRSGSGPKESAWRRYADAVFDVLDLMTAGLAAAADERRDDVDAEVAFHLEARTVAISWPTVWRREDARAQALREFGDIDDARRYMTPHESRTDDRARGATWTTFARTSSTRCAACAPRRVCRHGHPHARARHRRQHRDFLGGERRALPAVAVSGSRPAVCGVLREPDGELSRGLLCRPSISTTGGPSAIASRIWAVTSTARAAPAWI